MVQLQTDAEGRPVVHPIADLFPMLTDSALQDMADDIKSRGLLQPIVLDPDGRILDGRNRYAACAAAGVQPEFYTYEGGDPDGYALAVNIERRSLRPSQRYMIKAMAFREAGARHGVKIHNSVNRGEQQGLSDASTVLDHAPDLAQTVADGDMALHVAVEIARANKRRAAEERRKREYLSDNAPELLALVEDNDLSYDEAIRLHQEREEEKRARLAREAEEEQARASEEARLEHERSVVRQRDIESAVQAAANALSDLQSTVATILIGYQQGAEGLIDLETFDAMHATLDGLKEIL